MELEPVTFLFIVRRFYGRIFVIFNYEFLMTKSIVSL